MGRLLTLFANRTPSFNPASISGLALWFDASDAASITSGGGAVSQWNDKSGNGRNATQSTGAKKPTTGAMTLNGRNALLFDGGDTLATASFSALTQPTTIFIVAKTDDTAVASQLIIDGIDGTNRQNFFAAAGAGAKYSMAATTILASGVDVNCNANIFQLTFNNTSSQAIINAATATNGASGSASLAGLTIGSRYSADQLYLKGLVAEILVYSGSLSAGNRTKIYDYLSSKWFAISSTAFARPNSIVAFGDSITYGYAVNGYEKWISLFGDALRAPALNKGISGSVLQNSNDAGGSPRSSNGRDRYVADLTGSNKRDLCVINLGLNDLRYILAPATFNVTNYANDYQEIITGLLGAGYTSNTIIVCSPYWIPDTGYNSPSAPAEYTGSDRTIHEQYVAAARQIAVSNSLYYADVYAAMRDNGGASLMSSDLYHPNAAGNQVICAAVLAAQKIAS